MRLNRRRFFQAALLPAAALQSKTLSDPQRAQILRDHEADLAAPSAMAHLGDHTIDLFVRLEELDPLSPGELSGAKLYIGGAGEDVSVSASIGDVLQRDGSRTSHWLGFIEAEGTIHLTSLDPIGGERAIAVYFTGNVDRPETAFFSVSVVLYPGKSPELHLEVGRHCLGVLRGELLFKFFDCLRKRSAMEDARTF